MISTENSHSLGVIEDLGRKSKEIGKIMEIIDAVADQTKLIAFNAALEASSAGEAGRRFGVVGRRLEAAIRLSAYRSGQRAGSALHPGDDGVPLDTQADLARLAEAGGVGIRVTATAMLAPAKSLSMLVALGDGVRRWSRAEACRACRSQGRCRHGLNRREACA